MQDIISIVFTNVNTVIKNETNMHWRIQGGGGGQGSGPLPEKSQNIRFLSNTGPDPLKIHKATEPAFNVGPSSFRQRNVIEMAFRWRADDGPFIVIFGSSIHQLDLHMKCLQVL